MSRNRVADRAGRIYQYLRDDLNQPHRLPDLLKAVGLTDSATTRAGIKRARQLAEADGLCFPVACPANGFTYTVTDDPTAALDPALHLGRIEQGVAVTKEVHQDFIKSRMSQMPSDDRQVAKAWMEFEDGVRAVSKGAANITKMLVAMRRDGRSDV